MTWLQIMYDLQELKEVCIWTGLMSEIVTDWLSLFSNKKIKHIIYQNTIIPMQMQQDFKFCKFCN